MAYRDARDGLMERLSALEAEVAALRDDATAETERKRLRADRRDALASAQTRVTELEREDAARRAKRPLKASRHDVVKPPGRDRSSKWLVMSKSVGYGAAAGVSVFVLSDDQVPAIVCGVLPVVGALLYISGWRGEGL